MKKLTVFTAVSVLVGSCSSYKRPESIDEKMGRYQSKQKEVSLVPQYKTFKYRYSGRGVASQNISVETPLKEYTNKRVYFLTLLSQYNRLKAHSTQQPGEINHCPHFHTAIIDNSFYLKTGKKASLESLVKKMNVRAELDLAYHPEMLLPVTIDSYTPTVWDQYQKQVPVEQSLKTAFNIHLNKMHGELKSLCDYGQSDNYYIFENLASHIKKHQRVAKNDSGMKALMKTTIFSNMALIKSIEKWDRKGRTPASAKQFTLFEEEMLNRLGAGWVKGYFQKLSRGNTKP